MPVQLEAAGLWLIPIKAHHVTIMPFESSEQNFYCSHNFATRVSFGR